MADLHAEYRLDSKPIAIGGQAEVIRAKHRRTGEIVALKRRKGSSQAGQDRMRREIDVQHSIQHRNVMPILDFDPDDFSWFTMPLAEETLEGIVLPVAEEDLSTILSDIVSGLEPAHSSGHIHRDIKPSNVLRLDDEHGCRWVVADWGLVRRPQGQTTANHTPEHAFLGTEGFAPPEAYSNPHSAGFSWDAYSLGRIASWASTGTYPAPLVDQEVPEPWRRFVRVLTAADPTKRPQDMARVREILLHVSSSPPPASGPDPETLKHALGGDAAATILILEGALELPSDGDFFIDELAELTGPGLDTFVKTTPLEARKLLDLMDAHLKSVPWGRRSFDHYNVPLHWMQRVAQAAAEASELDLLEDACEVLFAHEPGLDRWRQARRSRDWIRSLQGAPAARVARILRENKAAAKYYGEMRDAVDAAIKASLRVSTDS